MNNQYSEDLVQRREAREPSNAPYHGVGYHVAASLDFYAGQHLVAENTFRDRPVERQALPTFTESRAQLPAPYWDGHQDAIDCYWWTWKKAFGNLRQPSSRSHISNYIDTAFNGCLFLWDSVFILAFGKYGRKAFDFQRTLDNIYAGQLDDGFLTREIRPDGTFQFHPHDPASTGPNILAWSEWANYEITGDEDRLACVFPVLLAYHRWQRFNRSWPDGSYYSCGLACGMDNMKRVPSGYEPHVHHGHLSWIDATAQAALSADRLIRMARVLKRESDVSEEEVELDSLKAGLLPSHGTRRSIFAAMSTARSHQRGQTNRRLLGDARRLVDSGSRPGHGGSPGRSSQL